MRYNLSLTLKRIIRSDVEKTAFNKFLRKTIKTKAWNEHSWALCWTAIENKNANIFGNNCVHIIILDAEAVLYLYSYDVEFYVSLQQCRNYSILALWNYQIMQRKCMKEKNDICRNDELME